MKFIYCLYSCFRHMDGKGCESPEYYFYFRFISFAFLICCIYDSGSVPMMKIFHWYLLPLILSSLLQKEIASFFAILAQLSR